ncbi:membrane protein insertase YidC [Candidatus Babeliales bacterium]|nr:membrane protein insertase YidC [Candidatus Babeliales bacterium]MBY0354080.1 membrane protein insertase YidC [Candidatus Babeliales bacterium]
MDRKLIYSVILSCATVWGFHYFFGNKAPVDQGVVTVGQQGEVAAGQAIRVPAVENLHKTLQLDPNIDEQKSTSQELLVTLETDLVVATFSSFGGVLKNIAFKEHRGENNKPLQTLTQHKILEDSMLNNSCFLLAFEQNTPYDYLLIDRHQDNDKEVVVFGTQHAGWQVKKTYTLHKDSYKIDVALDFVPQGKVLPINPRLFFMAPFVTELTDNVVQPIILNERSASLEIKSLDDVQGLAWYWAGKRVIFGASDRYFGHMLVSDDNKFVQRAYYNVADKSAVMPILEGYQISEAKTCNLSFYIGPKVYDHLAAVDEQLSDIMSFGWLSWLCKLMLKLLDFVYKFVGNYGLAIVVLSILLRLPFLPLSFYSRGVMEEYQKHQPFIQRIRVKLKNNPQLLQQEIMRYHKDHNLPVAAPLIGCLPILLQLPVLFSLYRVLSNYLDLYQAPFYGWITDLSAKDPFYVLPVLMGLSMIWQQSLTPGGDGRQRVVMGFSALVMTVVFAGFPAGVVLYWFMNNILTIGEDYLRRLFVKKDNYAPTTIYKK